MAKGKPRWEQISAYDLARKKVLGQASPEEIVAANLANEIRRSGRYPKISKANGRLIVR